VRDKLLVDKKMNIDWIKAVSNGGTIYLSGTVPSLDARQQALKIEWDALRVQSVVNALAVQK